MHRSAAPETGLPHCRALSRTVIATRPQTVIRYLTALIATVTGALPTVVMLVPIAAAAPNSGATEAVRLERMATGASRSSALLRRSARSD